MGTSWHKKRSVQSRPLLRAAGVALLFLVLCSAGRRPALGADGTDVETRVKVAFVYNFARFIEWPPHPGDGAVRIGVLGRGDLFAPLEEVVRGKTANGRPIAVIRLNTPGEADRCEILLLEHSESKRVKEIADAVAGKPVLTVCDAGNCLKDGGMVGFQFVDESVRFQINQEAAERAGLKISSQLLKVALPAQGKR